MDDQIAESPAGAPPVVGAASGASVFAPVPGDDVAPSDARPPDTAAGEGQPRRRRRWLLPLLLTPLVLVVLVVVAWAIDTSSGGVPRNVTLAGVDVGGLSEAELAARVDDMADELAGTTVQLVTPDETYETTAAEIGLLLDEDRTAASALAVGDQTFVALRPFEWLGSFVTERSAPVAFQVSEEQAASTIVELEGDARTPPTEPSVELVEGSFHVVPGIDGEGLDPERVAAGLRQAATEVELGDPIRVTVAPGPIPPLGSDDAARDAASAADALVDEPLQVRTDAGDRTINADELHRWVVLASQPDGSVTVDLDPATVLAALRVTFADIEGAPVDASFTLDGGVPVIRPDRPGRICCSDAAPAAVLRALQAGEPSVRLDLVDGPATFTLAEAQAWGIKEPVGGNHAWRNGAPTTAGPGFTTYHSASGARVINIHRMADIVRGAVVPPGGSFSINDYVGKRTVEKGFVSAGAIANGEHVDEIGGGVSQFATTTFNAAYFAGLEIDEYQAHSEYFDRYPRGREATMGFPAPDLRFTNNTPYGILIWTSYTDTSLTVTLYSTPYITADQTAIRESSEGRCRVVVTTRTRTFPDGHTEDDTFRARYRPGPGQGC